MLRSLIRLCYAWPTILAVHSRRKTCQGNRVAQLTCETLSALRSDPEYKKFWDNVIAKQKSEGLNLQLFHEDAKFLSAMRLEVESRTFHVLWRNFEPPALPRRRKVPKRHKVGSGESHFPCTVEEHYFKALDLLVSCTKEPIIRDRCKIASRTHCTLMAIDANLHQRRSSRL